MFENKLTSRQVRIIKRSKANFILFQEESREIKNIRFVADLSDKKPSDKFKVLSTINL